ncbi:MAG: response regulator [Pseudomonadota bacterium]
MPASQQAVSQAIENKQNYSPYGGRVLVVEDEPMNLMILSTYLRVAGYDVEEAEDGQAAWEMLSAHDKYDLVITDKIMPRMDGVNLALRIKSDRKLRDIPIIMQTGATSQEDILEGVKVGVFYYLAKPYEEATLTAIVRSAIQEGERKKIFDRTMTTHRLALASMAQAEFHFRTPEEAQNISFLLGSAFPRPELATPGLYELLINAVEHGNLGIGFDGKKELVNVGAWDEEVKRRLSLPENLSKRVYVKFIQDAQKIVISITDMGEGFDWRPYMEIEPSRATQGSGRGIAKANLLAFDRVTFLGKGNEVRVETTKKPV